MNIVINLDKPVQMSSQQAVTVVKRLLRVKKAGHAGTLDPLATGVLIVCLNEATKITRFLSDLEKEYIVRFKLGERTDTYDSTGKIIDSKDPNSVRAEDIRQVLGKFTGDIQQTPPMYSAVKIDGTPLYKLARQGISVDRPGRNVRIYQLELLSFHRPYADLRVTCSKGTYIRTLCDDIGNVLGTGAHMTSLTRTRVGKFGIEHAVPLTDLRDKKMSYHSMDDALSHLREVILDSESWRKARNGIPVGIPDGNVEMIVDGTCEDVSVPPVGAPKFVRLKNPDYILFGIGLLASNSIKPERILCS